MAMISESRFALLHLDDDDSDGGKHKPKSNQAKVAQQSNGAKKKNKKKKKADQQKENEQLRSLAFAKTSKGKSLGGGDGPSFTVLTAAPPSRSSSDRKSSDDSGKQWDDWQKVDKGFTAESYEKDLQEALMLSKIDFEEHKQVKGTTADDSSKGNKGKKKKKDKPAAMSLGEFQQSQEAEKPKPEENGSEDVFEDLRSKPTTVVSNPDPEFFDKVETDAQKIIRKEKIQEEYKKQYIVENARTQQYHESLSKKDEEIEKLKKRNEKLQADLKEVKERNQQLCHILAQGEMKGKTTVLLELDQLKQIRDELTEEVSSLTSELEKERSKVHALKTAADKSKGGKHGK